MKSITIQGEKRESVGKKSSQALRNAEKVPCVVYGEKEVLHFSADEKSFKNLVYTPEAHTVTLEVDGRKIDAILQDVQFHPVTDRIIHADFYELNPDKPVSIEVPVITTGRSKGVVRGGVLRVNLRKLKVRAIPVNLPDEIVIDVTPLNVGHKFEVAKLKNDKFQILHPDNTVVVAVKTSRTVKAGADDDDEENGEGSANENAEGTN
ncbi:50S ribosomal protein L25/general stress protein Ctc [Apibacter muscae]|uniref:Large ribosomal subunit protein bL25 n=1 Tax=Apibacter muscae TaxID=2509004 RepID=A0A563DCV0_9FLAO|nr:50S ribosomal protein L25/general stress protein Ctc [Apibacter muscae]TWP24042.1 50S ribosomal protein L25/general stress protein Ctc [Apibacter muscae]TWP27761.1 50S ribosomal protein L25/general stress protein Ctc [Apibacter muscae]